MRAKSKYPGDRKSLHTTLTEESYKILDKYTKKNFLKAESDILVHNKGEVVDVALVLLDGCMAKIGENPNFLDDFLTKEEKEMVLFNVAKNRSEKI